MEKICCIYYFLDQNKDPFYVGLTKNLNQRIRGHIFDMRNRNRLPSIRKANKLIKEFNLDFKNDIVKCVEICSESDLENKEIHHIALLKSQGFKLTNLTDGGRGSSGYTEKIQKTAAKRRVGQKRSLETRKLMSNAAKGVKKSEEHKKSLVEAWKTRPPVTEETKKKMSKSSKGKINIKKFKLIDPSGIVYVTDQGLKKFCEEHDLIAANFHQILNGTRKSQKGWTIERLS
jgi:group I intron endonuclease